MKDDIELLEYLFQSAKSAEETIGRVLNKDEQELYDIFKEGLMNNRKIANSAKAMLERRRKKIEDISIFSKMLTYMSIKINITEDYNIDDKVKIIIQDNEMRIDDINKKLEDLNIKSKSIINLAKRFIYFQNEVMLKLKNIKRRWPTN